MVSAIAEALEWPLVTLAPPDFLQGGIDGFEAQAEQMFRDLLCLRRVVVIFDECEELFRRRTVVNAPEHRTQSDFITSGMLPRLQDLRNSRWVVFAIATNTELDEIDPAVLRFGRLDGQQRIGHPDVGSQIKYLGKSLDHSIVEFRRIKKVLRRYDEYLKREAQPVCVRQLEDRRQSAEEAFASTGNLQKYFRTVDRIRVQESELPFVTFGVLDQLAKYMSEEVGHLSSKKMRKKLVRLAKTKGRPSPWVRPKR